MWDPRSGPGRAGVCSPHAEGVTHSVGSACSRAGPRNAASAWSRLIHEQRLRHLVGDKGGICSRDVPTPKPVYPVHVSQHLQGDEKTPRGKEQ